jgi:hypothetical protein
MTEIDTNARVYCGFHERKQVIFYGGYVTNCIGEQIYVNWDDNTQTIESVSDLCKYPPADAKIA